MSINFEERLRSFQKEHQTLIDRKNVKLDSENGIFDRYQYPVLTAKHIPLSWRFDFNPTTNPLLLERIGFNAVFNAGAIKFHDKYVLAARVEGNDRKSFFAIAESDNGIDNFRFHEFPIRMPQTEIPDTNIYDMRLVRHEDGWIYGIFCTERRDPDVPDANQSAAIAQCGIARTKNLVDWMRLPDIKTDSPQQRNVVLHPEFVQGKYAFYTRPQDGFIEAGSGGGIGFGLCDDIEHAVITCEVVMDKKEYHTIYEAKNGLGPAPIKTPKGWLHLAHGVRNTAAGLRYTLYMFMTDLHDLTKIIHKPAGYFMAPEGNEFIGDVPNVLFSNGWIADENGAVFIYYASSDTRMHVATSTIEKLMDYVINSPEDEFRTDASVGKVIHLVEENIKTKIYRKYVHDEKHVHF